MSAPDPKALAERLRNYGLSHMKGMPAIIDEAASALEATPPKGQAEAVAFADPRAIETLKGTSATLVYLSRHGSAAYSMPLYSAMKRDERVDAWASLRMIADAVGELFGPKASLESEEASLLRGPEFHHFAQGIVDALQRVASPAPAGRGEGCGDLIDRLDEAQSEVVYAANRLDDQAVSDAAQVIGEAIAALSLAPSQEGK